MKVSVKVSGSSGSLFGGSGQTVTTSIEANEHAFDPASLMEVTHSLGTVAGVLVRDIARAGHPEAEPDAEPERIGDDGEKDEPTETDDRPAAGWTQTERVSKPGDAVRIVFADKSTRIYIDTGEHWHSPACEGLFDSDHNVSFCAPDIAVTVIAEHTMFLDS